jgi:hypothetical protein
MGSRTATLGITPEQASNLNFGSWLPDSLHLVEDGGVRIKKRAIDSFIIVLRLRYVTRAVTCLPRDVHGVYHK